MRFTLVDLKPANPRPQLLLALQPQPAEAVGRLVPSRGLWQLVDWYLVVDCGRW